MCGNFIRVDGWDFPGNDMPGSPRQAVDYAYCCGLCQATAECQAFAYLPSSENCWLKTIIGSTIWQNNDIITGYNRKCVKTLFESASFSEI